MCRCSVEQAEELYGAARLIRAEAFERDGSVFTPGQPVWTVSHLDKLKSLLPDERLKDLPGPSTPTFLDVLRDRLRLHRADDEVVQLAAEVVFIYFWILSPGQMGGVKKTDEIQKILERMTRPVAIPPLCESALGTGVAMNPGYMSNRRHLIEWLIKLVQHVKGLAADKREGILKDPWEFKLCAVDINVKRGGPMRQALLHVMFPETFEPIVSEEKKKRYVKEASKLPSVVASDSDDDDVDRQLLDIRQQLTSRYGEGFNFWDVIKLKDADSDDEEPHERRYWWLNANPQVWSLADMPEGALQTYSTHNEDGNKRQVYRCFAEVAPGDLMVGYSTSPDRKVVAICEITKGLHQASGVESIEFRKTRSLSRPVPLAHLTYRPLQGSLSELTAAQYKEIEALMDGVAPGVASAETQEHAYDGHEGLFMTPEAFHSMVQALREKKNLLLQGAPGVGKTFVARRVAYALLGSEDPSRVEMVQFHQSYTYEDFVQGFRPVEQGGFTLRKGMFVEFCERAQRDSRPHVFIIDEINRGNLSKILGELMMLIEPDKRGEAYGLPLGYSPGTKFFVPENVHLLGLMNTADRSLAMVDYALRRRFRFKTLEPQFGSAAFRDHLRARGAEPGLIDTIVKAMTGLNRKIAEDGRNLGAGYRIGHSFFCPLDGQQPDDEWYRQVIDGEIVPLLQEYCLDDDKKLGEFQQELGL